MPKVIDHDERRNHIIDVTWNLIVRGGIESATMREIASEAGYANGALNRYFPNKHNIVASTFERAMHMVEDHSEAYENLRGLQGLRSMCRATFPLDDERVTAGRVLMAFWEMSLSNDALKVAYDAHLGAWRRELGRRIQEGREDGEILTAIPDEQLIDEIVVMTAGANVMTLVGAAYTTVGTVAQHLEAFFDRLTRP